MDDIVAHAQAAAAAGRIDKAEREASRSRSRARHTGGSAEGSRSNSLAREGGSTSRSGSRTRELLSKVFGGSSSRSASRDGAAGRGRTEESREHSRERALAAQPLGHGTVAEGEVANLYVVGAPSVNVAKHM